MIAKRHNLSFSKTYFINFIKIQHPTNFGGGKQPQSSYKWLISASEVSNYFLTRHVHQRSKGG